jgi:sugar lactone lactonase YvrE/chitodextrinase
MFLLPACSSSSDKSSGSDAQAPAVGTSVTFSGITANSITVSWDAATDDVSLPENLEYKLVFSLTDNLNSVTDAKLNGTVAMDWTTAALTAQVTGMTPNTTYWFAVLVRDEEDNEALYDVKSIATIDLGAPAPGSNLIFSLKTTSSVTVTWGEATDDDTTAANLQYKLVYSTQNNLLTAADAETNGTVAMDWTPSTLSKDVTGLASGTTYWFGVLVKNEAGRISVYPAAYSNTLIAGIVTTIAGTAGDRDILDGIGPDARFSSTINLATDGSYLYVSEWADNVIRKMNLSTLEVTTFAGSAGVSGSADGTGLDARFNRIYGLAVAGDSLYVCDDNNSTIRKIVLTTGEVSTFAGTAGESGSADGIGGDAGFNRPAGMTTDGTNLYVCDSYNKTVRKIVIATREVTTLAGTAGVVGSADGTGPAASFRQPMAIATDGTNLYVAETSNYTIRKIVIATAEVTTLAGTAGVTGSTDGTGADARFNFYDTQLAINGTTLYFADSTNYTIRSIDTVTGEVTTLAGTAGSSGSSDGTGADARFTSCYGLVFVNSKLYTCEWANSIIRKIE